MRLTVRIGTDGRKLPRASELGPIGALERAAALGADGLFFRTLLDMSPSLDMSELFAIRDKASELGIYLETGLGKVNPFALAEAPELRAIGGGDTLEGFRHIIEAAAQIGCTELWAATANFKPHYYGRFCYDRFRTDVTWKEQLEATGRLLKRLQPIASHHGVHINLETHEEITSFEVVDLVERAGPDTFGIVFDTANVLHRVEHPVWAAKRVAPYVRQTHIKDGAVMRCEEGLTFQIRTCGTGMVDFTQILPILAAVNPGLHLTVENEAARPGNVPVTPKIIELDHPAFLAGHPDLTAEEHEAYRGLIEAYDRLIREGSRPDWKAAASVSRTVEHIDRMIVDSMAHLRSVCAELGLPVDPPAGGAGSSNGR